MGHCKGLGLTVVTRMMTSLMRVAMATTTTDAVSATQHYVLWVCDYLQRLRNFICLYCSNSDKNMT